MTVKRKPRAPHAYRAKRGVGVASTESLCRAYLLRMGYRLESPTERAIRFVQAQWIAAGIDLLD